MGLQIADVRTASADAGLVTRAASGDAVAFDRLIQPRLGRLFRMAVAIVRHEADAADAVQDACVQAWRELPRLRDHERFDAWLAQILVNSSRAVLRRRGRAVVRQIAVDESDRPPEASLRSPAADEALAEREAIVRAFERLNDADRTLLGLHYVEEVPLAEIGRLTGSPLGTVKWRLFNARRALDRALRTEHR